jgi:hypothetical protein
MRILFINNHGGGFADHIQVGEATTRGRSIRGALAGLPARGFPNSRQSTAGQR